MTKDDINWTGIVMRHPASWLAQPPPGRSPWQTGYSIVTAFGPHDFSWIGSLIEDHKPLLQAENARLHAEWKAGRV